LVDGRFIGVVVVAISFFNLFKVLIEDLKSVSGNIVTAVNFVIFNGEFFECFNYSFWNARCLEGMVAFVDHEEGSGA